MEYKYELYVCQDLIFIFYKTNNSMNGVVRKLSYKKAVKRPIKMRFVSSDAELVPRSWTIATETKDVHTIIDGQEETTNVAHPGDFILCGVQDERYVLTAHKLADNYNLIDKVLIPRAMPRMVAQITSMDMKGVTEAYIIAPWGEHMLVKAGDYIVKESNGKGYYRIAKSAFHKTYIFA